MSKKDSNKKGKRNYSRTIDLVFLLILMIIMVMAFYIAFTFGILPQKWIMIAAAVFAVIFAILFILSLKKLPKWAVYTKRVFILLLCALLATGGYFLDKTRSTLRKVSSSSVSSESNVEKLMVIVPKDSNISSIKDLENATIGFQNSTDKDNAEYVKQQLSGKVTNYTAVDALDYTQLITDLLDLKTLQALAISETYYNMSAANIDVKIHHLMMLLSTIPDLEILALDSCECFDTNKVYVKKRLQTEQNEAVRKLLQADFDFLDEIQLEMSSARQFVFALRFKREKDEQIFNTINRVDKAISEHGFAARRMSKPEIKRMLALFFGTSISGEEIPDIEGETEFDLEKQEVTVNEK